MATQQNVIIDDESEDGLMKAMMMLSRAISQRYPTLTNNRLRVSSNVVQTGLIDTQGKKNKNVGNAGNCPQNVRYAEHGGRKNERVVKEKRENEKRVNELEMQKHEKMTNVVPFEQRNEPPEHPKVVYAPILDINYFRHFLDILENYNPMDDEPMWAADRVVAPTPGSAITIPETANEFSIKGNHVTLVKGNQIDGRIKTDLHKHIHEFLRIFDMFKYIDTENEAKTLLDELNEGTIKTWSGKSYDAPTNLNDQQNDPETPINFDSEDEDEESTPQPKSQTPKPVKETSILKPYKPKIPYPQRLRKEKMEAQYGMLNYGKFLKELISNKHKLEQISSAFLSDESSAMIQNKVPPKLGDLGSFLILCNFSKAFPCNALADLAENMLVEVGKFTFPVDFVILEMEEDSKIPLILGRLFLHTVDGVIRVKRKQLNLGVGTKGMTFSIDSAMKHSYSNDDTCFNIDVIDEILEEDFDALLDKGSKILHSIEGTILKENSLLNSMNSWQ
ncbi:reverse transcriptase domain-containing protein [Tanacetum coccineum]